MSERRPLVTADGALHGWVEGGGRPVLLLHGGPGLSYAYLDGLVEELDDGFEVAAFQQRGLAPSTVAGPFTVEQALLDVVGVLDALEWPQALVLGHSWGGHLALRFLAARPDRLIGVLAVDPLGIVGDGGREAFEKEIVARIPAADRARAQELDERAMAGEGTPEEALQSMALAWPAYFADPESPPPVPDLEVSVPAYSEITEEISRTDDSVASAVARTQVPYGVLAGAGSPMPWGLAARASAELSPGAFLTVVPGAGHFPWVEVPGSVRAALERL